MITIQDIIQLAVDFSTKTGQNPTHVLMTEEQQKELSENLYPIVKYEPGTPKNHGYLTTINVGGYAALDVLPIDVMRYGSRNGIVFPKVLRIENE